MSEFKVLIVGGSVAGLTLAHCLEKLDIRYEILEKHDEIAPQVGASVGIMPNGALILDQLGLFDDIESVIEPLEMAKIRYPDGFYFKSEYPLTMRAYFGYPISFLERQKFLSILYSKLHHKDRVHTGQKVLSVRDCGSHAVMKTADTEYTGHLVVGADGVHSIVRSELWKLANKFKAGTFQEDEKNALKVEYACIYGISTRVPGVKDGVQLSLISRGVTIHIFNGTNCKVFWFVIVRLEKNDVGSDRPRYDDMHARKICDSLQREKVDADLTFGDVWVNCDIFKMTPLEEGLYERWHFGRLFCIGDAVHKLTPNLGQGANLAIEDAAALANALCKANLGEAMLEAASMERLTRWVKWKKTILDVIPSCVLFVRNLPLQHHQNITMLSEHVLDLGGVWPKIWLAGGIIAAVAFIRHFDYEKKELQFKWLLPGQHHLVERIPNSVIAKALSWQRSRASNPDDAFFREFSGEFLQSFDEEVQAIGAQRQLFRVPFFSHAADVTASSGRIAVPCFPMALKVIARLTTKSLFGAPLCRDGKFLELCCHFGSAVPRDAAILRCFPEFSRRFIAPFMAAPRGVHDLQTAVCGEIKARRQRDKNPLKDLLDYSMKWVEEHPENGWEDCHIAEMMSNTVFAALHTSSQLVVHVIFEIATRPDYLAPLREEIKKCFAEHGDGTKAAIDKMYKMDSFIKETQRCNPLDASALARLVLKPYTFTNGLHVPAGCFIFTPNSPLFEDEQYYSNPQVFDGMRFARMREHESTRAASPFTATSEHSMHFGMGRHACPGRFMVSDEVKLVLVHLLTHFDFAIENNGPRPRNVAFGKFMLPDMGAKIWLRRLACDGGDCASGNGDDSCA
ncbi:cytochrome P450 monooxygenase [Drechmeria coniospora]|uniref:Cytochrome P450 monooxygenase n=1 Tax=Drechmeria coniospora TaxID=98403 RepID=A0A151GU12_DRECN|nr:cytochrome P450 monooxygenase [Drechmeria coniospora]KYK60561.1 cytochrome P450 monooxygenase [Drechmeria coniospora]